MNKKVLMFHDVYRDSCAESGFQSIGANHYKINETLFTEQLKSFSRSSLIWTFDDGGVSFYSVIAPLLEQYNLRGHFFVVTDCIGSEGFLSAEQIRELYNRGHVIGSHSASHPENLGSLSYEARKEEWTKSVTFLNGLIGTQITEVSIPNGYFDFGDIPVLRELGISKVYTSSLLDDYEKGSIQVVGRIGIDSSFSPLRIKQILSGGWLYKRLIVRQKVLCLLKRIMGHNYLTVKAFVRRLGKEQL